MRKIVMAIVITFLLFTCGCGGGGDSSSVPTTSDSSLNVIPALLSPKNGSYVNSYTPHFIWTPVPNATYYRLNYSGSNDWGEKLYSAAAINIGNTCEVFDISLAQGGVLWKVKAFVNGSWQPYSSSGYFEIHIMY